MKIGAQEKTRKSMQIFDGAQKKTRKSMRIFNGAQQRIWRSKSWTKTEKKGNVVDKNVSDVFIEAMERELGTIARDFRFFVLRVQESLFRTQGQKDRARNARRTS